MKGAADCGAAGQAASVRGGRGGGSSSPSNTERGGGRGRHAVAQGAAGHKRRDLVSQSVYTIYTLFSKLPFSMHFP